MEATSSNEIRGLIELAETRIKDAGVIQLSDDWRFAAAYNALLILAGIPLRAFGYRVPNSPGHHTRTFDSLALTIGADDSLIRRLKVFARTRGKATYEVAGAVSEQDLTAAIKSADELYSKVMQWMRQTHPELLQER